MSQQANEHPPQTAINERLISHGGAAPRNGHEDPLASIKLRLRQMGDLPDATVDQQIRLLEDLSSFELGRFLLENRGLNAYWTHRLVTYGQDAAYADPMSDLEYRIFEGLPAVLATRERFGIFLEQLQGRLRSGLTLASVPCGLMGEFLLLDYGQHRDISLVGVDLDQHALNGAFALAQERGLADRLSLRCEDAWTPSLRGQVDVLASNGLNLYEPDDARVTALYRSFFDTRKAGGTLVTSFMTPPPTLCAESPWNLAEIDPELLLLQQLLFVRIIDVKWSALRTHALTMAQLEHAGFVDITFIDDRARMFPTVVARKPS